MNRMMKTFSMITLTLLCICFSFTLHAQEKQGHVMRPNSRGIGKCSVIGQAPIKVIYALNANDISDEHTYLDSQVLLIGKGLSKLYSRFLELNDSLHDDFIKQNPNANSMPRICFSGGRNSQYWSEYQFTDIYSANGIYTCYATMPWAMERYNAFYTEPMYQQHWTLSNEQLSILGYDCQKATCQWRGRTFEAWFTTKIPTRLGPWIFGGLPGLILKIYDKDHLYTWEAVEIKSGNFPIVKSEYKGFVKDTREHIYKLQVAANRDHLKTAGARDYQTGQLKSKPHPYEPLEKE